MKVRYQTSRLRALAAGIAVVALLAACTDGDEPSRSDDGGAEDAATADEAAGGLRFDGPNDGELVNAAALEQLTFTVRAPEGGSLDDLVVLLDGQDVTDRADVRPSELSYAPRELSEGERTVVVASAPDGDADAAAEPEPLHTWRFEVKTTPPPLELTSPDGPIVGDDPVTVAGVTDAGATVEVAGQQATADDDGRFELEVGELDGELTVVATDLAGNATELVQPVARVASRVEVDDVRAVHATFWAWATPSLREPIVQMIEDGQINAVQLDLKDEGGHIGYDSGVALAQEVGAAFADPALASWAWEDGERGWVIQDRDGSDDYRGSYAGFPNFVHPDVIAYNLDLAEEAAKAGVDHILWDYIRRPEGIDNYVVPGLETTPEEAIAEFARLADERLAPYGIQHGASVYGIAADRPTQIGQDIPAMAEHLDYVAPMIYPSHWGVGKYGVADPNRQPYDIVRATLEVWDDAVEGRRARVVPWLEDTSYRAWDRPFQIREQIRATRDHGIDAWLMWNPGSRFTPEAYERRD